MPHFVSGKDETVQNMNDITSDFACIKVSALEKASRISGGINRIGPITIGPDSAVHENEGEKSENIENEQNSCNIEAPQKSKQAQNNKISTQSGITFSVKKILLESELQRREEVQKEIERHWQHMKENGKAIQEHIAVSRSHLAKERERKSKENYAYILAEERIAEQEEIKRRREQQKEVEEYRKRMKEKEELRKKITNYRNHYKTKYHNILTLTLSGTCKDKNAVAMALSPYAPKLKDLCQQVQVMDEKLRTGDLVLVDLNNMETVVREVDEILYSFKTDIIRINTQYEMKLANNMELAKQLQEQQESANRQEAENAARASEVVTSEPPIIVNTVQGDPNYQSNEPQRNIETTAAVSSLNLPQEVPVVSSEEIKPSVEQNDEQLYEFIDKESLEMYIRTQQYLENYVKSYDEFLQSASTKKFRFECQKALNIPVNAISGISEQHLRDKYERLHSLLIGKSSPNLGQHSHGAAFCKNILAKKIVNQGETLVSSKPKMAFPIAAIVVALWNDHPDFGDLLLAHFHKTCPFTVPLFMPKIEGQSNEDYYRSMGYKYDDDGTVEKHDKFLKRMSGLMRLYASITITPQRKGIVKTHPYGVQNAWRWLAAALNIVPRPDVTDLCATLILDMLEVAGSTLWLAYPKQFHKLLIMLSEEYYPRMQSVGCIGGGPLVRLEEFLKNALTNGTISPADGQLPTNFW